MELARENLMLKHQLQVATVEVTRLRQVCEKYIQESDGNGDNSCKINQSRYWTDDEHRRFLEAIQKFGHKDVKAIANFVGGASCQPSEPFRSSPPAAAALSILVALPFPCCRLLVTFLLVMLVCLEAQLLT